MSDRIVILTVPQVCDRLSISEPTLRRYSAAGGDFPAKIKLGPRRVGFLLSEVELWLTARHEAAKAAVSRCSG